MRKGEYFLVICLLLVLLGICYWPAKPVKQVILCEGRTTEGLVLIASTYHNNGKVVCSYLKTSTPSPQVYPGSLEVMRKDN